MQSVDDESGEMSTEKMSTPDQVTILDQCGPPIDVALCSYLASVGSCGQISPADRYHNEAWGLDPCECVRVKLLVLAAR